LTNFDAKLHKIMKLRKNFIFALLILTLMACKHDPLDVDISNTKITFGYTNLDSLIYNTPAEQLPEMRQQMGNTISEIFDYQIGYCMRIGRVHDTAFVNSILQYRADPSIQQLEAEIAKEFKNLNPYKQNISLAFKYLKTQLPDAKIPKQVVFQNTLFNSSAFCTENEIGIGLEQYLGKNSPTIKRLPSEPFYDWMKEGFDKTYLERDAVLSWILTHVLPETNGNLAEKIIYYGKALYLTEASMPNASKNIIARYTAQDLKWADDNEYSFWKYLVDENMLFKTDERAANNMLSEGPFTPGLPEKGPDRLGQFLGWKIVKNYMENTKISFEDLIQTPYNEILQKYEPK
jgi:hypothetical protein